MIETLKVQNYKSLKNIEIPLRPLTVLVGPNAAGKSNILDCLTFLSEIAKYRNPVDFTNRFNERGGYINTVWGGRKDTHISINTVWRPWASNKQLFDYSIEIQDGQRPPLSILKEYLLVAENEVPFEQHPNNLSTSESLLNSLHEKKVQAVKAVIESWIFYDFVTQTMRHPQPVAKQTRLNPDGSNVATLLHWIFSEERKLFAQVEEHLKAAIPEVDELMSPLTEDGRTYVAWREKDIPGRIPAWNMSEGSVRLVAILLGLLVPQPPPLVTFENPDLHLHAHLMQYLAEILKAGSRHSQIIITTHSPYLLDHIPPENVLIVWKEAGETKVKPVGDTADLKEALKTLGLGELYYAGHFGGVP